MQQATAETQVGAAVDDGDGDVIVLSRPEQFRDHITGDRGQTGIDHQLLQQLPELPSVIGDRRMAELVQDGGYVLDGYHFSTSFHLALFPYPLMVNRCADSYVETAGRIMFTM